MINDFLFGMFVLVSFLDAISTYHALKDGKAQEVNKFMAKIFEKFGLLKGLLLTKVSAIAVVWYTMSEYSVYILSPIIVVYLWVVWSNYKVYRSHST